MALVQITDIHGKGYIVNTVHVGLIHLDAGKQSGVKHEVKLAVGPDPFRIVVDTDNLKLILEADARR